MLIHGRMLIVVLVSALMASAAADGNNGKMEIEVIDKGCGDVIPCRIHVKNSAGEAQRAEDLPFWHDHFVCPGSVNLDLPSGKYTYEIERGPEYSRATGSFSVVSGAPEKLTVELERLADMASEGWWSGELHVHRSIEDMPLLMQAEDLHVAPVITWWFSLWNYNNHWAEREPPEDPLARFDGNRYCHVMAGEDERAGGAVMYFNLPRPLPARETSHEYPSPVTLIEEARRDENVSIDIEKPFWWDVPTWLALGLADSVGVANNHMCRDGMHPDEAWGRPRDAGRLPPPLGNGYWSQEIYYHMLNCGLRVPPSAGSASGVLPNPLGYNRVYVHVDGEFSYAKWWEGLRAGHSFVTNGPLLRPEVSGRLPGHVFVAPEGNQIVLDVNLALITRDPISSVEIIKNGRVERKVPFEQVIKTGTLGKLTFEKSGWFLIRVIADNKRTFRFASTAPYYVEIGEETRRISKASAQFFLDWVRERIDRIASGDPTQHPMWKEFIRTNPSLEEKALTYFKKDPTRNEEVLAYHRRAEAFWQDLVSQANAD